MSYGDCNFPPPRVDMFRRVMLVGVLLACVISLVWAAACDVMGTPPKTEHVAQGPRNLPDGNTHLAVEKRTSL